MALPALHNNHTRKREKGKEFHKTHNLEKNTPVGDSSTNKDVASSCASNRLPIGDVLLDSINHLSHSQLIAPIPYTNGGALTQLVYSLHDFIQRCTAATDVTGSHGVEFSIRGLTHTLQGHHMIQRHTPCAGSLQEVLRQAFHLGVVFTRGPLKVTRRGIHQQRKVHS